MKLRTLKKTKTNVAVSLHAYLLSLVILIFSLFSFVSLLPFFTFPFIYLYLPFPVRSLHLCPRLICLYQVLNHIPTTLFILEDHLVSRCQAFAQIHFNTFLIFNLCLPTFTEIFSFSQRIFR